MRRRDCDLCHNLGKCIDRRETRIHGFTVYVDCQCGRAPSGWRKVLAEQHQARELARARGLE